MMNRRTLSSLFGITVLTFLAAPALAQPVSFADAGLDAAAVGQQPNHQPDFARGLDEFEEPYP